MSMMDIQRRLTALGFYNGRADGIWGDGTETGIAKVLTLIEAERGVVPPAKPEIAPAVAGNFPLPAGLDKRYAWLGTIGTLPRILQEALKLYGLTETPGAANNPAILALAKETGLEKTYTADSIAWCGLLAAAAAQRAGYDVPAGPLWALNWRNFGIHGDVPSLGDVLAFVRDGGGHVGFYVGEDSGYYHVLGGNTSDKVTIARIAKSRLKEARRPAYKNPLASWKPYTVTSGGAISKNEA